MFNRLFGKKKQEPPLEDQWTIAEGADNGFPLIFRIRSKRPLGIDAIEYPHLVAISWSYEATNESGMPPSEATELMAQFEGLLDSVLEPEKAAFLTVVVTGNGVREWQWYSRNPDEMVALVNQTLTGYAPFPVQFSMQNDPEWQAYENFLASLDC